MNAQYTFIHCYGPNPKLCHYYNVCLIGYIMKEINMKDSRPYHFFNTEMFITIVRVQW